MRQIWHYIKRNLSEIIQKSKQLANSMPRTKSIKIRTITDDAKKRIRELLRHGDLGQIAIRCSWITYRQVSNVIHGRSENDEVWKVAIEYLNDLEDVEIDARLADYITEGETEAA